MWKLLFTHQKFKLPQPPLPSTGLKEQLTDPQSFPDAEPTSFLKTWIGRQALCRLREGRQVLEMWLVMTSGTTKEN